MRKVKHGEIPGQVPRSTLIRMRERPLEELAETRFPVGQIRAFRRYMKRKTVKVERRRSKSCG